MNILTSEAAQQIEDALKLAIRTSYSEHNNIKFEAALASIRSARAHSAASDFVYQKIEDYEELCGFPVNEAFKIGWRMARTTNAMLGIEAEVPKHDAEDIK